MKKTNFLKLIPAAAAFIFFGVSCSKSGVNSQSLSTTTGSKETPAQQAALMSVTNSVYMDGNLSDDNYSDAMSASESSTGKPDSSSCRVITYNPSDSVYPHQETIDFGNGCLGSDGITRKGQKIITAYVDPSTATAGQLLTLTTFNNYYEDTIAVQGQVKVYLQTTSSPGPKVLEYVQATTYTSSNGSTKSVNGTHYWTQISGSSTPKNYDDTFSITGTATGIENLDGNTALTYTSEVDQFHPLIKAAGCYYRTQGQEDITIKLITGGSATFDEVLDYGNGTCDNIATLSINGGTPQEIDLPLLFWPLSL